MPYLVVENGSQRGLKVEIARGQTICFGRDPKADITTADHLCSRRHFEVEGKGEIFVVRDLGSSNGTHLNDERVSETEIKHGDALLAGETRLTFLDDGSSSGRGLVGKEIGGYRILERIGRGGMGTVFKANQTSLSRVIALKILSPKVAQDPAFVKRFHAEARAAGRLNHPNIVQVYDVGSSKDLHFYSMEYIENGSLQDMADRDGTLDLDVALATMIDAARGLEYAEKKNLVHRDIKPDNLMVNSEGVVKIADLGLAHDTGTHVGDGSDGVPEDIFGTPHFISPEQAQGKKVDTRSDIYSLGAAFYRLVTGQTPFDGDSVREIIQKQILEPPTPPREVNRDVPAPVSQVIEKMMRKDPDERQQSASELLDEFLRIQAQLEGGGGLGKIIAAAVLVLAIGAGAFFFSQQNGDPDPTPADTGAGQTGGGNNPDPEREARLALEKMKSEARTKILDARSFDVGQTDRKLETLDKIKERYESVVASYADTEIADFVQELAKDHLKRTENDRQKLIKAQEDAAAAAAAKLAKAKTAYDAAKATADKSSAERRFGAALIAAVQLRDGGDLGSTEYRSKIDTDISAILRAARERAQTAADEARTAGEAGRFDEGAGLLTKEADLFAEGLDAVVVPDDAYTQVQSLAKGLREQAKSLKKAKIAKARADLDHDQKVGFAAQREALQLLAKSFDPTKAEALLTTAKEKLRTDPWRARLDASLADVRSALAIRDRFVAAAQSYGSRITIKLPSKSGSGRDVTWTLQKVTPEGFETKRSRFTRSDKFADFSVAEVWQRVFAEVLTSAGAKTSHDEIAGMFLAAGQPAMAKQYAPQAQAAMKTRVDRELKARELVANIRALERSAQTSDLDYLKLLPELEKFLTAYQDTATFLLNSNGTTPLVPYPEDDGD